MGIIDRLFGGAAEDEGEDLMQVDLLQRPGQAAQNLAVGNVQGAIDAAFSPERMTPREHDAFLKKHGLDHGPYASIFRAVTNPALLLSLALSYKFPVPSAQSLFKLSSKVEGMMGRFPILGRLGSMQSIFRGSDIPDTVSEIVRDVNDFRSRYGTKMGNSLRDFEQLMGRGPNLREQVMLSAWLDGLHKRTRGFQGKDGVIKIGEGITAATLEGVGALVPKLEEAMGPNLVKLAGQMRGHLDEMWDESFSQLKNREQVLKAIARQKASGFQDDILDAMEGWLVDPKKIPDYYPHRALRTEEEFRRIMQVLTESSNVKRYNKAAQNKMVTWLGPEFLKREYRMMPSLHDLKHIEDLVDRKQYDNMLEAIKSRVIHSAHKEGAIRDVTVEKLKRLNLPDLMSSYQQHMQGPESRAFGAIIAEEMPTAYSLKLMPVLNSYNHTMASTYGWTVRGGGEKMMDRLYQLKALAESDAGAKRRVEMLENTYIPIIMGRGTFRQAVKAQAWEQSMTQLSSHLDKPFFKGLFGDKLTGYLKESMQQSRGAFSLLNLNRKASSYFYMSTLGLNPGAALRNLMQVVLTTGPTLGVKSTTQGITKAFDKSHKYFALRLGPRKTSHEEALRVAFPEYAESGLIAVGQIDEAVSNALRNATEIALQPSGKLAKVGDKIGRAMMSMFTASETAVRLATFEAGLFHASRSGLKGKPRIDFATKLTETTQFVAGPQNKPYWLLDAPPVVSQFLNFPLKMLEFATSTAMTLGSGEKNVLGYNPGTFARMVAGSVMALELGNSMGVDLSQGLLGQAIPGPQDPGRAFAPLPMVPPFFQLVGSTALGLASGDFSELLRSTPLLVPGGVSAFRAMGFVPPGVPGSEMGQAAARWAERTYADYQKPTPDGRIAVYSGEGQLKGFYSPWDLVKSGLGLPSSDIQKEGELLNMVVKNRDQIREYRRTYLEALFRNDPGKAFSVLGDFKTRFGFDLPVSQKDVEAMQARRQMTRLEQVVETLPPGPARDQAAQMISTAFGGQTQQLLGVDPTLLGEPRKARQQSRGTILQQSPYLSEMGPLEQVNPSTLGRQTYPQVGRFGF